MIEKIPEGIAEFGSEECCAVAHAFAKNKEVVAALKNLVEPSKLKTFADILINTKRMAWVPSFENKIAYEQIIHAELSRLASEEEETSFHCNHSKEEHIEFLRSALAKIKTVAQ